MVGVEPMTNAGLELIEDLVGSITPEQPVEAWTNTEAAEVVRSWRITNKAEAAWAMEKLVGYASRQAENDQVAADRIAAIRDWQNRENGKLQGSVDYFTEQLRTWHMSMVTADPNDEAAWKKEQFKTIKLPDGEVSVRKGSLSTIVEDESAFNEFVDQHVDDPDIDALIERKLVPVKAAIKKYVEETGESLPGVRVERSEPTFTVKPKVGE
jgi:hypothetical protein